MPPLPVGYRHGYTHTEPTREGLPRLFTKEHFAKVALNCWLAGTVSVEVSYARSFDDEADEVFTKITPVKGRHAEDMEVVAVTLIVPE